MTIEMLTRDEAERQRAEVLARVHELVGTDDRDELRELDMNGQLTDRAAQAVSRLSTLDFLIDG